MADYKLISADSHVYEPPTMWVDYIDAEFKDQGASPGEGPARHDRRVLGDARLAAAQDGRHRLPGGARRRRSLCASCTTRPSTSAPPAAYEPSARLVEMERDGIEAEVIYTTQGSGMFRLSDAPLQLALFKAYNTWLSEFCSHDPTHLLGLALIPLFRR